MKHIYKYLIRYQKPTMNLNLCFCKNLISHSCKTTSNLHKPLLSFSIPIFFFSSLPKHSKSLVISDYLIDRHGLSSETASKASSVLTRIKNPEKSDSILVFLKESGFSMIDLERIIKNFPRILRADLHKIKLKIELFQDMGFTQNDLTDIISSDPWILTRSAGNRILPSIILLKSVLGANLNVCKVLKLSGWFLKSDLEKTMIPNIKFIKSCGVSESQITKFVYNFPRFFLLKPDVIKAFVQKVDELGFNQNSKMFLYAVRAVSSMTRENWELKFQVFQSLGFSENDVLSIFRKVPQVFTISIKKIREGTQLLLSTGKYDIAYIVQHPELLIYSIEGRVKPRLQVVEILESKNLLSKRPKLSSICKMTDRKFFNKYVEPYPTEIQKNCMVTVGNI